MDNMEIQSVLDKALPSPKYLDFSYIFKEVTDFFLPIVNFIKDSDTWLTLGLISNISSIILLIIIIFCFIRIIELQIQEKEELNHEINNALLKQKEMDRDSNPRWHYIETLIESPNDSDWRVAIIEADTMLEDVLVEKGLFGSTVSELLESARSNGYSSISDAWEAHLIRNKIAHEGSEFSLSQIEGRRVVKMYRNFFEELGVIK